MLSPRLRLLPFLLAGGIAAFAQSASLIENDQVRVLKALDQPQKKTAPHEHKLNRVMVYLSPATQEITPHGGQKTVLKVDAGDVKWSPASGMHVSEVVSAAPLTIIELEIKKPGDPSKTVKTPLDPLKVAPKNYKVEFENPQVRVVRVKIGPHQKVAQHEHVLNRVVVYLTDQNTRITAADGKVEMAEHKAGEASWGGATTHTEENLSDKPFEAVVVEFKN